METCATIVYEEAWLPLCVLDDEHRSPAHRFVEPHPEHLAPESHGLPWNSRKSSGETGLDDIALGVRTCVGTVLLDLLLSDSLMLLVSIL